jgi:hypothetical protein
VPYSDAECFLGNTSSYNINVVSSKISLDKASDGAKVSACVKGWPVVCAYVLAVCQVDRCNIHCYIVLE